MNSRESPKALNIILYYDWIDRSNISVVFNRKMTCDQICTRHVPSYCIAVCSDAALWYSLEKSPCDWNDVHISFKISSHLNRIIMLLSFDINAYSLIINEFLKEELHYECTNELNYLKKQCVLLRHHVLMSLSLLMAVKPVKSFL